MNIITDRDIAGTPLEGLTVAVIGYGNQGEAHALNLHDAGVSVVVGLRAESLSRSKAELAGLRVLGLAEACAAGDVVALMVPDDVSPQVMNEVVAPHIRTGAAVLFAHGFPLRFGGVEPPAGVDVVMVAPMGPGLRLRERFVEGGGLPGAYSVERDVTGNAKRVALEYASAIGLTRVGLFRTTAAEETEIDLFSEQAVLCGGVTRLVRAGFETLVEAGYPPELAYMECLYELDLTVNLMRRYGIEGMRKRISRTALFGDLTRGDTVVGDAVREGMRRVLKDVRDGTFARELLEEQKGGGVNIDRRMRQESERLIEKMAETLAAVAHGEE
ncbi:MAG: ketol-acid reductoisomerase [Candidatus Eisenbacteria bacterium]|nr:ketol-acid reductoisomerase [Candidatus Eisenbacteria bacterium]